MALSVVLLGEVAPAGRFAAELRVPEIITHMPLVDASSVREQTHILKTFTPGAEGQVAKTLRSRQGRDFFNPAGESVEQRQ